MVGLAEQRAGRGLVAGWLVVPRIALPAILAEKLRTVLQRFARLAVTSGKRDTGYKKEGDEVEAESNGCR